MHAEPEQSLFQPETHTSSRAPRARRRCFRYRLRTLLLSMLLASLGLTWFVLVRGAARRQASAVETILELGGSVVYDFRIVESTHELNPREKSAYPQWLLKQLGVSFFHDVIGADLSSSPAQDVDLSFLETLSELRWLVVNPTQLDRGGVAALDEIPCLTHLRIVGDDVARVKLEGLQRLRILAFEGTQSVEFEDQAHFPELKTLVIRATSEQALDALLAGLERMPNLEQLVISPNLSNKAATRPPQTFLNDERLRYVASSMQLQRLEIEDSPGVTDAGLEHLGKLANLRQLRLVRVPVSTVGLKHLEGLKSLKSLVVTSPQITAQQLKELNAAMPNVEIRPFGGIPVHGAD